MKKSLIAAGLTITVLIPIIYGGLLQIRVDYVDVSDQKPYSEAVGKRFESTASTLLIGYREPGNEKGAVDAYALESMPGFDGRYVVSRLELPPQVVWEIVAVEAAEFPFDRVEYIVNPLDGVATPEKEVRVDLVNEMDSGNLGLDKQTFRVQVED